MKLGFSYIGLIWLVMLFVPNFIWMKNKPKDYEEHAKKENKVLLAFERVGQFIVTPAALIFSNFNIHKFTFWSVVLLISFICMVIYEIFWIRYFRSEKTMKDFYRNMFGIAVPGASLPVVAFFLLGIYGGNIIMILGSVILGIGHIGIHLQHRKEVWGKKPKKKLPVRIILGILKAVVILLLVVVFGFFIYAITGRNINEIRRAFEFKDGINEELYVPLKNGDGFVRLIGKDQNNPVILSLHGGPGEPAGYADYLCFDGLTDEYTIAIWDESGCGRSYYRNKEKGNTTLPTPQSQQEDIDSLVDYLCGRFNQDKVVIMGHSYGTVLGSTYVSAHPEKVTAFISIGQVVSFKNFASEHYAYEDALAQAKAKGDDTTELEKVYKAFCDDAFKFLDNSDDIYDLIILDPPAFAKHRGALHNALKGYTRLNVKAFQRIRHGGVLFTFSCSQVVTKDQFRQAVFTAAAMSGRKVRILHQLHQPADHPINIYHPEGEYLKGLVLYVE